MLFDNSDLLKKAEQLKPQIDALKSEPMIFEPFMKDFRYRFCWNSNRLEGNTLSLDETIEVIDYDTVRSGHSYTEYQEAKNLFSCIQNMLKDTHSTTITEDWICRVNGQILTGNSSEYSSYRSHPVYIGTLAEAVYYPPAAEELPELMRQFADSANALPHKTGNVSENAANTNCAASKSKTAFSSADAIVSIATQHIRFERIHPFPDGNGRTGRMILNQQLLNCGLLPIVIENNSKYRQAFRQYHKNEDASMMVHLLCKEELAAFDRLQHLKAKYQAF